MSQEEINAQEDWTRSDRELLSALIDTRTAATDAIDRETELQSDDLRDLFTWLPNDVYEPEQLIGTLKSELTRQGRSIALSTGATTRAKWTEFVFESTVSWGPAKDRGRTRTIHVRYEGEAYGEGRGLIADLKKCEVAVRMKFDGSAWSVDASRVRTNAG